MAPRQLFPGRPPAPDPVQSGGLLSGFVNPFADMDAATQGGLLALAGNLMSARDRGMSFGGALGMGLTDFAQTKAALAGQEDRRQLQAAQTKAAERELAADEKKSAAREKALGGLDPAARARAEAMGDAYWTQEAKPTWRLASPEEREQGIAAMSSTGEPKMLPGEYFTSGTEQFKQKMDELRFMAEQGNREAMLRLQEIQIQLARDKANQPTQMFDKSGALVSVTPQGQMTELQPAPPRERSAEEMKQLTAAQNEMSSLQGAQAALKEMQTLNPDVPGGPLAGVQKWWDWVSQDTDAYNKAVNFENLLQSGMLEQLKTTFSGLGAMSNADLQTFRDAQAALDKPPEVRTEIFRRMEEMMGRKMPALQQRLHDLETGKFGVVQPDAPAQAPAPAAPAGNVRRYNPATGGLE